MEIGNKIILKDSHGNSFEVPKRQGSCSLVGLEITTKSGDSTTVEYEGGFPAGLKGKFDKKNEKINSVKGVYECQYE